MAGNTRGKLKEEFEGIHRNLDWIIVHTDKALALIREHKPELSNAVKALGESSQMLDEISQSIYSQL